MITSRQQRILNQLMEANDYISLHQLSDQYGISDRTVRLDLQQLEDWLREHNVKLERHRLKGVRLSQDLVQMEMLEQKMSQRPVFMDSNQRINLLLKLLLQKSIVPMEQVTEDFGISISTLLVDLAVIKEWVIQRNLKFNKARGTISISGSEQAKRSAYLELLRAEITEDKLFRYMFNRVEKQDSSISFLNMWFKSEDIQIIFATIQQLEEMLDMQFADAGYSTITLHLLMAMERLKQQHTIEIDGELQKELESTEIFQLIKKNIVPDMEKHFGVQLPQSEIGYMTQHVLGAQKQNVQSKDDVLVQLANEIIKRTEVALGYQLQLTKQAVKGFSIHLKPAIYRAKFNLQLKNPLMKQLEQQYGSLLEILEKVVNDVMGKMSITFDRDEIGYIMLHIASGIVPHVLNTKKRVTIVCGSGIGTSAIIKRRLSYIFPQLEVVRTCSYKDSASLTSEETDAVLTTIDISHAIPIPWLKVSPLLTEEDQQKIANFWGITSKEDRVAAENIQTVNDIMKIVDRNTAVYNRSKLLEELLLLLQGASIQGIERSNLLSELLPVSSICLQLEPTNWESAVRFGSRLLISRGCSNVRYEQKLVDMIISSKHSFLIHPGVYFPHAYMPDDVTQTAFSLVTFREPVLMGPSEHPVWLMITLAAVDKEQHITALSTLLDALNDSSFVNDLKSASNPNEIWERLQNKEVL